jgi:acylphosphatase
MGRSAISLRIEGRVQGVGYRWWAVIQARRLGVDGWVRNLSDGAVEALAIGAPAALDGFAAVCRQGPSAARVTVVLRVQAADDGSEGFEERATV